MIKTRSTMIKHITADYKSKSKYGGIIMLRIDSKILETNNIICENISSLKFLSRGTVSQNVLQYLRHFVEYIDIKIYSRGKDIDPDNYDINVEAIKYVKTRGELRFLDRFHEMLQKSVSHYVMNKDGSERLMLKYYEYLLKIRTFLQDKYNMNVLENLKDFPIDTDKDLEEYYEKIAEKIEKVSPQSKFVSYSDNYYIQKIKPFFVKHKIYYEVTFTAATSSVSKFERVIAFTSREIPDNYAVKFKIRKDEINVLNRNLSIQIIDEYRTSIRPCELNNLCKVFGYNVNITRKANEYSNLMKFLTKTKLSLTDIISSDKSYYDKVKSKISLNARTLTISGLLDKCREIVVNNRDGSNLIRYLLYKANNAVIKSQLSDNSCNLLSGLYVGFGCIPFEKMPFCTSLINHNPRIYDLLDAIPEKGHEHEFLARRIKYNTENEGKLFTSKDELAEFVDINSLVATYNSKLHYKHKHRKIEEFLNHLYISEYANDCYKIILKLKALSSEGIKHYTTSVESWISEGTNPIDDEDKKTIIKSMFADSRVAIIYGAAGTGKSTMLRHISNFWADKSKIFLSNTHPAVDNLQRKVNAANSRYYTAASFIYNDISGNCDILMIDECSTISNSDMKKILDKARFKLLVLVGDVYQIESVYFGNWFGIAQKFINKNAVFELTHPFRTEDKTLITLWDRVRNIDDSILEILLKNDTYYSKLNESLFEKTSEDEIILCLNYDGLYGINNVNRLLQSSNPNKEVQWGINIYKVGDPILFNEKSRFSPLIHNNSKGKIAQINVDESKIHFFIELDTSINELDASKYDFELAGISEKGKSIISFIVNKLRGTDEDDDYDNSTIVPFQVAYAVSIHKAQGLEYDSVKIIITKEVEERITHNIFYTAITRTKNKLRIFWSPEIGQKVLKQLVKRDFSEDANILKRLFESYADF